MITPIESSLKKYNVQLIQSSNSLCAKNLFVYLVARARKYNIELLHFLKKIIIIIIITTFSPRYVCTPSNYSTPSTPFNSWQNLVIYLLASGIFWFQRASCNISTYSLTRVPTYLFLNDKLKTFQLCVNIHAKLRR